LVDPEILKALGCEFGVSDSVLDIPVTPVVLYCAGVKRPCCQDKSRRHGAAYVDECWTEVPPLPRPAQLSFEQYRL